MRWALQLSIVLTAIPLETYNIERTICDLIRSRSRIDVQIFEWRSPETICEIELSGSLDAYGIR